MVPVDKHRVASALPYRTMNGLHRKSGTQVTHNFGFGPVVRAHFWMAGDARSMFLDRTGDRGKFTKNSRAVKSKTIANFNRCDDCTLCRVISACGRESVLECQEGFLIRG